MASQIVTLPTNVEEMTALQKLIDKSRFIEIKNLEDGVDESKKR